MAETKLVLATEQDAELIHQIKYEAFLPLYEKYHDDETNPVKENVESVIKKIGMDNSEYYLIKYNNKIAGGIRAVEKEKGIRHISPLFVLPEYQNFGIGSKALELLFELYPATVTWRLTTILQEERNCHFYEKYGFYRTNYGWKVNDDMTLVGYERENEV